MTVEKEGEALTSLAEAIPPQSHDSALLDALRTMHTRLNDLHGRVYDLEHAPPVRAAPSQQGFGSADAILEVLAEIEVAALDLDQHSREIVFVQMTHIVAHLKEKQG